MNDTNKIQHNFFIPKSVQVSKGANAIVSYLHFYFENHDIGKTKLHLRADFCVDNCVAQNKNNIVMGSGIANFTLILHIHQLPLVA